MNSTARTARTARTAHADHADQLAAALIDARCCDALDPCDSCRSKCAEVQAIRHAERVAAMTETPRIPRPRTEGIRARLAAVSA